MIRRECGKVTGPHANVDQRAPAAASERRSDVAEGDRERAGAWGKRTGGPPRTAIRERLRATSAEHVAEGDPSAP